MQVFWAIDGFCEENVQGPLIPWMLYENHIGSPIRRRTGQSRFQRITYGLRAKGYYTGAQTDIVSYAETI